MGTSHLSGRVQEGISTSLLYDRVHEKSSLNKVTTFQLRQFIIEAGFDIESWIPNMIANKPPDFLTKPPYHFNPDELRTCEVTAVCRKSSAHCYQARLQDGKEEVH